MVKAYAIGRIGQLRQCRWASWAVKNRVVDTCEWASYPCYDPVL